MGVVGWHGDGHGGCHGDGDCHGDVESLNCFRQYLLDCTEITQLSQVVFTRLYRNHSTVSTAKITIDHILNFG